MSITSTNAKIMIPDSNMSPSPLPSNPSIKKDAASRLRNACGRSKTSAKACKQLLRKNRSCILGGFSPGKYDVLCNRSRRAFHHVGNRRFRVIVEIHAPAFAALKTKADRSMMIHTILEIITSAQGKFIEKNKAGQWDEVGLIKRKEKIGHALRAAIMAGKSEDKPRTIYDVLGEGRHGVPNSREGSSTQVSNKVKNEESLGKSSEHDLFDHIPSFDEDECQDDDHEGVLFTESDDLVQSADSMLPHFAFNKRDDGMKWAPFSLADAFTSTLGMSSSNARPKVADTVFSTSPDDAGLDLHDWSPTEVFADNGQVGAAFEMFTMKEPAIQFQYLQSQLADTAVGLDDFFSTNPEVAY